MTTVREESLPGNYTLPTEPEATTSLQSPSINPSLSVTPSFASIGGLLTAVSVLIFGGLTTSIIGVIVSAGIFFKDPKLFDTFKSKNERLVIQPTNVLAPNIKGSTIGENSLSPDSMNLNKSKLAAGGTTASLVDAPAVSSADRSPGSSIFREELQDVPSTHAQEESQNRSTDQYTSTDLDPIPEADTPSLLAATSNGFSPNEVTEEAPPKINQNDSTQQHISEDFATATAFLGTGAAGAAGATYLNRAREPNRDPVESENEPCLDEENKTQQQKRETFVAPIITSFPNSSPRSASKGISTASMPGSSDFAGDHVQVLPATENSDALSGFSSPKKQNYNRRFSNASTSNLSHSPTSTTLAEKYLSESRNSRDVNKDDTALLTETASGEEPGVEGITKAEFIDVPGNVTSNMDDKNASAIDITGTNDGAGLLTNSKEDYPTPGILEDPTKNHEDVFPLVPEHQASSSQNGINPDEHVEEDSSLRRDVAIGAAAGAGIAGVGLAASSREEDPFANPSGYSSPTFEDQRADFSSLPVSNDGVAQASTSEHQTTDLLATKSANQGSKLRSPAVARVVQSGFESDAASIASNQAICGTPPSHPATPFEEEKYGSPTLLRSGTFSDAHDVGSRGYHPVDISDESPGYSPVDGHATDVKYSPHMKIAHRKDPTDGKNKLTKRGTEFEHDTGYNHIPQSSTTSSEAPVHSRSHSRSVSGGAGVVNFSPHMGIPTRADPNEGRTRLVKKDLLKRFSGVESWGGDASHQLEDDGTKNGSVGRRGSKLMKRRSVDYDEKSGFFSNVLK